MFQSVTLLHLFAILVSPLTKTHILSHAFLNIQTVVVQSGPVRFLMSPRGRFSQQVKFTPSRHWMTTKTSKVSCSTSVSGSVSVDTLSHRWDWIEVFYNLVFIHISKNIRLSNIHVKSNLFKSR